MLFPVGFGVPWVLEPVAGIAREIDDDEVGVTVLVEVLGPASEAVAVAAGAVTVVMGFLDFVEFPVGGLVPTLAGEDVHLAVIIDVGHGDALGAELLVEHRFFPSDGGVVLLVCRGRDGRQHRQGQREQAKKPGHGSHGSASCR